MAKPPLNLQDGFLNQVRKENIPVQIGLVNGTRIDGMVRGFDNFTIVVESTGRQELVYKHAVASIVSQRPVQLHGGGSPS